MMSWCSAGRNKVKNNRGKQLRSKLLLEESSAERILAVAHPVRLKNKLLGEAGRMAA